MRFSTGLVGDGSTGTFTLLGGSTFSMGMLRVSLLRVLPEI